VEGDRIDRVVEAKSKTLGIPREEVKQRMLALGAEPSGNTPGQFASFIRADQAKWWKLMRERGIQPE